MPKRSLHILAAILTLSLVAAASEQPAEATPVQPGFSESVIWDGLTEPADMVFAPDGRVFVAEKSGLIKVLPNLNATTPVIAADLRTQVYNFWDRGLLGIALDPQFPARPYVYALYAVDAVIGGTPPRWGQPGVTSDPCPTPPGPTADGCVVSARLSRLTLSGSSVVNEQVLINDWCQQYPSHSAGSLVFGPDGKLYASGGDGASFTFVDYGQAGQPRNPCGDPSVPVGANQTPPDAEGGALRAQDLRTPLDPTGLDGTIIRIDPDTGAGAPGNPLSASADPNARRIVGMGMRNPFRFAFRPGTTEIWFGDVGWSSWEEINRIPRADDAAVDNFGWPCYEGDGSKQSGYQNTGLDLCDDLYDTPGAVSSPLFAYSHSSPVVAGENCAGGGSSTSGLAFYQGGNYPAAYADALFFADYSRRCIWVMFERDGEPDPATRRSFLRAVDPVNLEIGPGGDVFVVDFAGSIRRIAYPGGNRAPTAVATADPGSGPLPLTVSFDGLGSSDPDADDTLEYDWDLDGDGQYDDSTHPQPTWTYTTAATVTVRLRVTDEGGLTATDSVTIGAGNDSPDAQIDTPSGEPKWAVGDEISFSGHASDAQDGPLGPASMTWSAVLHHCVTLDNCHEHPMQTYDGVAGGEFTAPDHDYPSYLELRLTVTDSGGLSDTASLRLDPRTVDLTFRSNPPGPRLAVGSEDTATPFTRTVIVGSRNTIAAPTPQLVGGSWQRFVGWSDGGARSHEITAPAADATYTATYEPEAVVPGLVMGLGFDETSGTAALDASPANNAGVLNGATRVAGGRFGRALSFDGVDDRVDVADSASLDLTTGMTLEAWVRPTSVSGWRTGIVKERGTDGHVYALYPSNGATPVAENYLFGGYNAAPWGPALPVNAWSHIASTYDGELLRLYVNGEQVAAAPVSGAMAATANPLRIGGHSVWGEHFAGLIDEVRVYDRALSAANVVADMNTPITAVAPSDTTPPSAPSNLQASGSLGQVSLSWGASTDNVAVTGYEVYRSTTAGFTPAAGNRIATVGAKPPGPATSTRSRLGPTTTA